MEIVTHWRASPSFVRHHWTILSTKYNLDIFCSVFIILWRYIRGVMCVTMCHKIWSRNTAMGVQHTTRDAFLLLPPKLLLCVRFCRNRAHVSYSRPPEIRQAWRHTTAVTRPPVTTTATWRRRCGCCGCWSSTRENFRRSWRTGWRTPPPDPGKVKSTDGGPPAWHQVAT